LVELWIPYGEVEVSVRLSDDNLAWLADPGTEGGKQSLEVVRSALQSPIDTKNLKELIKPGSKVVIAIEKAPGRTDKARLLQLVLEEVFSAGIPPSGVEVILSSGTQPIGNETLSDLNQLLKGGKLASNDPREGDFSEVGVTSFGTKVELNRSFVNADVRIVIGEICANWFYGFGGPWSVALGMCSQSTIAQNGRLALKKDAKRRDQGAVHLDLKETASMAKIDLALAVVPSRGGTIHDAFAGTLEKVYERSVDLTRKLFLFRAPKKADILLVGSGGLQFDSTLLRACDALFNFVEVIEKDGRIVLVAECRDGPGGGTFFNLLYRFKEAGDVLSEIRKNFSLEGYKAMKLLELREKHGISIVSAMPTYFSEKVFAFRTADTANEGLQNAFRYMGRESKIGIAVDGSSSLAEVEQGP